MEGIQKSGFTDFIPYQVKRLHQNICWNAAVHLDIVANGSLLLEILRKKPCYPHYKQAFSFSIIDSYFHFRHPPAPTNGCLCVLHKYGQCGVRISSYGDFIFEPHHTKTSPEYPDLRILDSYGANIANICNLWT